MPIGFDLLHYVHTVRLKRTDALLPLFEAIVNSIHSIEGRGATGGSILVKVEREGQALIEGTNSGPAAIRGFYVTDNGQGFTEANMMSFETFSSALKSLIGGKGIGRFLWLKAFDRVNVESTFRQDGAFYFRRFTFLLSPEGIKDRELERVDTPKFLTTVHLDNFKKDYREACRHTGATLAQRVLDHCMIYFLGEGCPRITLLDGDDEFILNDIFSQDVSPHASHAELRVKDQTFDIVDLRRAPRTEGRHRVHFCANNREVTSENLATLVPELETRLSDDSGEPYVISSYLSGKYLDDAANPERTAVTFDRPESLLADAITRDDLYTKIADHIRGVFGPDIESASHEKVEQYRHFIEDEAPEFRVVLNSPEELQRLPRGLGQDRLKLELFRIKSRMRLRLKEEGNRLLSETPESVDEEEYRQRLARFTENWNQMGVSDLANYVLHRKLMLDFLAAALHRNPAGKYSREEAIHKFVFPLKATSNQIEYDQQNLWIIDERLAYHYYLASDKSFDSIEIGEFEGRERPDLIIFNRSFAFVEEGYPLQSVVIVEFKRPMRDDYSEADNPISQVRGYIKRIRDGKALDNHGRPIPILPTTAYYAYILSDLTPKLRELAESDQFDRTPDGMGYFQLHRNFNTYFEIISFEKLLNDAQKRNRVLFDKLNLPTH